MRVIVAGSRTITDYNVVKEAVESSQFEITCIISGGARGVDDLAVEYGQRNNINVEVYRADWTKYGRSAGPIRNTEMARIADALIAIWDGESPGTRNMIDTAKKYKLDIYIFKVNSHLGR